jgi:hypothetical protein
LSRAADMLVAHEAGVVDRTQQVRLHPFERQGAD